MLKQYQLRLVVISMFSLSSRHIHSWFMVLFTCFILVIFECLFHFRRFGVHLDAQLGCFMPGFSFGRCSFLNSRLDGQKYSVLKVVFSNFSFWWSWWTSKFFGDDFFFN